MSRFDLLLGWLDPDILLEWLDPESLKCVKAVCRSNVVPIRTFMRGKIYGASLVRSAVNHLMVVLLVRHHICKGGPRFLSGEESRLPFDWHHNIRELWVAIILTIAGFSPSGTIPLVTDWDQENFAELLTAMSRDSSWDWRGHALNWCADRYIPARNGPSLEELTRDCARPGRCLCEFYHDRRSSVVYSS